MWLADAAEWEVVSTMNSFHLESHLDTLLVKLPGLTVTPGFGGELHLMDTQKIRLDDEELFSTLVTEKVGVPT